MVYGYNANVLSDVSTGRLRTFAETFLERLLHTREGSSVRSSFDRSEIHLVNLQPGYRSPLDPPCTLDGGTDHQTGTYFSQPFLRFVSMLFRVWNPRHF